MRRAVKVWFLGASVGCAEEPYGDIEYLVRTEHFEIAVHSGAQLLCTGEYNAIEDLLESARAAVNYQGSTAPIELHLWSPEASDFPCESWSAGCTRQPLNEIHVRQIGSLHHEVVHAAITTDLADFYSEGFAESLSEVIPRNDGLVFDPRPLLEADSTDFEYWQAAVFVNFMIEEFGAETAYRTALAASTRGADSAFLEWTGQSIDVVVESFMTAPYRCGAQINRCSKPPEAVESSWVFESSLPCSGEHTLGTDGGEYHVTTLGTTVGTYTVEVEHGSVILERCAPCEEREFWSLSGESDAASNTVNFSEGHYALLIYGAEGLTTRVRINQEG